MSSKTYLILGSNGFIGSHLVDSFSGDEGTTIRAFDRFNREPTFLQRPNVEVVKGDIFNEQDITAALEGVDYVIHCFSATTPFVADADPFKDITDNIENSVKIFSLCSQANVKKVGFISSGGAVYGTAAEKGIVSETDAPLPVSPYGIGKLALEHYLEYFKRTEDLEYIVYRVTNPYGPRQHTKNNQGVIPAFINKIMDGEPITVYGDGSTSRDFIYIEDAARMITDSFEKSNKYPVYNLGSGRETSLNEIIGILKEVLRHKDIQVNYREAPKTFLAKTQVNIRRYTEEFGQPELTSMANGLRLTLENKDK